MALIECPECGKDVSDRAYACPNCGFPIKEYVNGKTEGAMEEKKCPFCKSTDIDDEDNCNYCGMNINTVIEEKHIEPKGEILIAHFKRDYLVVYQNGIIKIKKGEYILYKGDITNIKVYAADKSFYNDGNLQVYVPNSDVPRELLCLDSDSFAVCKKIKEEYDLRMEQKVSNVENNQPVFKGMYRYGLFGEKKEVYCPRCNSWECSPYKEQKIIPGKTKTTYTANLNPLKPFTLVNKKEKVVRKEQTYTENKFICNKCGKIFY